MTLTLSVFNDRSASAITPLTATWDDICARFANPPEVGSKAECILFSACEFGDKRTENGSLRSNDNVLRVWAAVGDYDGEKVQPNEAVALLNSAGVRALVYTSPSHEPNAPRWRVVAPFDTPGDREKHIDAVERLNTIVGGGLSSESFTLSQPFYIGRVKGKAFGAWRTAGQSIEKLSSVTRTPWRGGARNLDGSYRVPAETLLDDLRAGVEIHPAIVALAARGYSAEELSEIVEKYGPHWPRPERAEIALREDIPRAVKSWERKKTRELEIMLEKVGAPPPYGETTVAVPRSDMFASVGVMTGTYNPTQWLIKGVMEHPTNTCLFGEPSAGKSFSAIAWACSVALGRRWNGRKVRQGPVVYLAGEGFGGLSKRFLAWRIANNVAQTDWDAAPLFISRRPVDLLDYDAGAEMWAEVTRLGIVPSLVVIDTLSRMTPGMNENDGAEMSRFVQWCDKVKATYGATVLIVHHTGKFNKQSARGSSVLLAAVDTEIRQEKGKEPNSAILTNTKMKDAKAFEPMHFKFEDVVLPWVRPADDGDPEENETSAVLVLSDMPVEKKVTKAQTVLIDILRDGQRWGFEKLKQEYGRLGDVSRANLARNFRTTLDRCLEAGTVIYDTDADEIWGVLTVQNVPAPPLHHS